MKKVEFGPKPAHGSRISADKWVENRDAVHVEITKRLTIDVPYELHKRIRTLCLADDRSMAEVVREILEEKFPVGAGKS
jgi:hypothetical protein